MQIKTSKVISRSRRRANTTNSDILTFDANGHHKPTYKHPKPSQKCGPYQLNRVNSMHSSSLGTHSMDSLLGGGDHCGGSSGPGSVSGDSLSQRSKSEAASPLMTGASSSFAQLNGQLPPLDLSGIKYPPYIPNSADFFGNMSDHEQPMFSAGLSAASVDWSNYEGLDLASKTADFAPSSYSQSQSYGGYDFSGSEQLPTMTTTTSTSGDVSEVEDFLSNSLDDFETFRNNIPNGFGLGATHTQLLGAAELGSLDYDEMYFMKKTSAKFMGASSLPTEDPTLLANNASVFGGFPLEDEQPYWINDFSGLPNVTDSPTESNLPSFWDNQ